MYWWDAGWDIQVLFTVDAGLRPVCIKPKRRPLGSSYPFVPVSMSVCPSDLSHVSVLLLLGEYPSNLKISTSKIGEDRTTILDILHIDLCTFRCCKLHRFPTKALMSNSNYFWIIDYDRQLNNGPRILVPFHSKHGSETASRCRVTHTFYTSCHFCTLSSPALCPLPA
jgi:hypothetical protein